MAITALNLITGSMRLIGSLSSGEGPSAEEQADGLSALNQLISSWSDMGLLIYQVTQDSIPLTGLGSYAIPAPRPVKIKAASISANVTASLPLTVATPEQWAQFMEKGATGNTFGRMLFYAEGYPLGTIFIAPRPPSGSTLEIVSIKGVASGPITVRDSFPLTGAASYTIGAGGTFAGERPIRILAAAVSATSMVSKVVDVVTAEIWAAYPDKTSSADFAEILYCDGSFTTPTVQIAPRAGAGTLDLYSYRPLAQVATISTSIDLPPGYERALRFNLAIDLAPEFGRPLTDSMVAGAKESKDAISGLNASDLGAPLPARGPAPPPAPVAAAPAAAAPVVIAPGGGA